MSELDAMIRAAGSLARRMLIDEGSESLVPMYVLAKRDGEQLVIGVPWRDQREKLALMAAVKDLSHKHRAVAALFLGESWVVKVNPLTSWHAKQAMNITPSEHPDRVEIVFAVATDGTETKAVMWQIVRARPGGPIIALVEDKIPAGEFGGRLLDGILPAGIGS